MALAAFYRRRHFRLLVHISLRSLRRHIPLPILSVSVNTPLANSLAHLLYSLGSGLLTGRQEALIGRSARKLSTRCCHERRAVFDISA